MEFDAALFQAPWDAKIGPKQAWCTTFPDFVFCSVDGELLSSKVPKRSHWNCTLTRP